MSLIDEALTHPLESVFVVTLLTTLVLVKLYRTYQRLEAKQA